MQTRGSGRARVHKIRFGARGLAAAVIVAGAAATAVVVVTTGRSPSQHVEAVGPAGYRVAAHADGSVDVIVRWDEVRDPAALQAALDKAGAHTKIWVTRTSPTTPWCAGPVQLYSGRLDGGTVEYSKPGGGSGLLIRPRKFPPGVTLLIVADLSGATSSAPPTASALPTGMVGFHTLWVTGAVANCAT